MAPAKPRQMTPFDPQALLEAQRRNLQAFTNAGEIVVGGMRTYAERQASMMQEAVTGLLGELHAGAARPQAAAAPAEQIERVRAVFERMVAQVQELSQLLIKVQSEAVGVLNACAMRNLETLGARAPDFSDLQARAQAAFDAANRETTAVVDEMKKRMATIEGSDREGAGGSPAASTAAPAPAAAPAEAAAAEPKPPAAEPKAAAAAKPASRRAAQKPATAGRATRGPAKPKG